MMVEMKYLVWHEKRPHWKTVIPNNIYIFRALICMNLIFDVLCVCVWVDTFTYFSVCSDQKKIESIFPWLLPSCINNATAFMCVPILHFICKYKYCKKHVCRADVWCWYNCSWFLFFAQNYLWRIVFLSQLQIETKQELQESEKKNTETAIRTDS